ncbi:TolC family protein [bacterium endosymbiont of Bathymodiolus sp. 5 South]|uniref:TolC family protein n=1 Tax=bacterium endosymbiont of Bathymodiolus sp. 5 South TaxID=1181670 RepID=UPI0010B0E629|nr:TolC family protein [bacterium endosymbiont of Bathymodiolus sp. 5 South]SSC06903.1 Channel-tunnel spanning the outer membrane and periplasm segregation of daughter chromosomes [bacterium endosymbiont of Bathymodiolus sp. 5 South]
MKIIASMIFLLFVIDALALTEKAFIDKVLSQDTNFEKDKIYVAIKQIELDASKRSYADWNADLSASLLNSYYDIDNNTTSTAIYDKYRYNNNKSLKLSIKKNFLSNPSTLTFSVKRSIPDVDITRYKQDALYIGSDSKYSITTFDNTYKISYKYPLLKHGESASGLKTYRRDILDLEREKFDFDDAQEGFLVARLKQFIDWNFYQKNAEVYQDYSQSLTIIQVNKVKDKSKLNTAILRAKQDISSNDSKLQSLKRALVSVLNDSSLWFESPKINTEKRSKIMPDLTQYLQHNVRFLLKLEIDKRLKKIDLDYHNNQSLYKLDFNIDAERNDNKGNTMTAVYKSKSILYTAGLNFSMPIGVDVNNQKDIQVAQLNLQKLNIDYNNKLKDIRSDVEALIVGLNLKKKALDTYQKLRIGVESEANLALKGYLNDSVSITALIDVYQEKRDVELDYVKALKDYQESLLKYDDKLDRVLTRY